MLEIDSILAKSKTELDATGSEIARSIAELSFKNNYAKFLQDGEPRVLFQGEFLGNTFPLYLIYQGKNTQTIFSYEGLKTSFQNAFRKDVQGNISDYPKYVSEITLTPIIDMPDGLSNYIGKKIQIETVSYLLKAKGDGKLRKIEYTRYFDMNNKISPIAERWEGKSWEAPGVRPSNKTVKETPVFAVPMLQLTHAA